MKGLTIAALLLIAAGTVGLVFSPFSYNKDVQTTTVGPVGFAVREQRSIAVPDWATVGAILAGSVLLMVRKRPSRAA